MTIPAEELVPGDIVLIKSGDKIPADLRLITSTNLQVGGVQRNSSTSSKQLVRQQQQQGQHRRCVQWQEAPVLTVLEKTKATYPCTNTLSCCCMQAAWPNQHTRSWHTWTVQALTPLVRGKLQCSVMSGFYCAVLCCAGPRSHADGRVGAFQQGCARCASSSTSG